MSSTEKSTSIGVDHQAEYFFFASSRLLRDETLHVNAKCLYCWAQTHDSPWRVLPKVAAKTLGISDRAVLRALRQLEERGVATLTVEKEEGRFRKHLWTIKKFDPSRLSHTYDFPHVGSSTRGGSSHLSNINSLSKINSKSKEEDKPRFEEIWIAYERKGSKKESLRRWLALSEEKKKLVEENVPQYVAATPELKYRKNFESYLNKETYLDRVIENEEPLRPLSRSAYGLLTTEEKLRRAGYLDNDIEAIKPSGYLSNAQSDRPVVQRPARQISGRHDR